MTNLISGCATSVTINGAPMPSADEQAIRIDRTERWVYLEIAIPSLGHIESLSLAIPADQFAAWAADHLEAAAVRDDQD